MSGWYARPVVAVSYMKRALGFYLGDLGFTESWRFEIDAQNSIVQVERDGCELILTSQWPDTAGAATIFISLDADVLDALRAEYEAKGAPVQDGRWGYRLMTLADPDGNRLWFPYPADRPRPP